MSYRLNHITLCVKDPGLSSEFYQELFDLLGLYIEKRPVGEHILMLGQNGLSIGLMKNEVSGSRDGVDHFGFTTGKISDLESLSEQLTRQGTSFERKKHRDGSESIFINDPDKYSVQVGYMPQDMFIEKK